MNGPILPSYVLTSVLFVLYRARLTALSVSGCSGDAVHLLKSVDRYGPWKAAATAGARVKAKAEAKAKVVFKHSRLALYILEYIYM